MEKYEKRSSIKTQRNRFLGRNEALLSHRTTEEAKAALPDINMHQGWTAEIYRITSKDGQIRVNEGYSEEQNNTLERSQQKEIENTNANEDNVTSSSKE